MTRTSTTQTEQHKLLTGWIPVVKIFNTRNRAVRTLWLLFTVIMVVALVSSISVVVHRYFSYVTVVRLDQRGTQDDMPPPSVTICLNEHAVSQSGLGSLDDWNIVEGISKPCSMASVKWNSENDAVSPLYARGGHFKVSLKPHPDGCYSLKVFEQVPRPPNSVCTTFQLTPSAEKNHTYWKMFVVDIELAESGKRFKSRPLVIAHEQDSFPLDNYGRYIYEYLTPGTCMNIFYTRIVTKRLQTWGRPCGFKPVKLLGRHFDYDQIVCQWDVACRSYHGKCNCMCPLELIRRTAVLEGQTTFSQVLSSRSGDSVDVAVADRLEPECPYACDHAYPVSRVNASVCPLACETVSYKTLNQVMDSESESSGARIMLIQAEGFTEETEEELYSLPKLFSEIGGLSSFCFGFSCMLFCELFELIFWIRCVYSTPSRFPTPSSIWEQARSLLHLGHQTSSTSSNSSGSFSLNNEVKKQRRLQSRVIEMKDKVLSVNADTGDTGNVGSNSEGMDEFLPVRKMRQTIHTLTEDNHVFQCRQDALSSKPGRRLTICSKCHHKKLSLSPHKLCRVDGSRLSGYPSDQDSPIWWHNQRRALSTQTTPTDKELEPSTGQEDSTGESDLELATSTEITVEVCNETFRVPIDVFRRKSS